MLLKYEKMIHLVLCLMSQVRTFCVRRRCKSHGQDQTRTVHVPQTFQAQKKRNMGVHHTCTVYTSIGSLLYAAVEMTNLLMQLIVVRITHFAITT